MAERIRFCVCGDCEGPRHSMHIVPHPCVEEWAICLFPGDDEEAVFARRSMISRKEPLISVRHFPVTAIRFRPLGARVLVKGYTPVKELIMTEKEFESLKEIVTSMFENESMERERDLVCICHWGPACEENLRLTGQFHLLPQELTTAKTWIKQLCPQLSAQKVTDMAEKNRSCGSKMAVARHHFRPDQLSVSCSKVIVKTKEFPRGKPWVEEKNVNSKPNMETLYNMGQVRQAMTETGQASSSPSVVRAVAEKLVPQKLLTPSVEQETFWCEIAPHTYNFDIIEVLCRSPSMCNYYTHEPCFEAIEDLLEYLDCDGAFTHMRFYDTVSGACFDEGGQVERDPRGRLPVLSLRDSLVAYLITFRRFRSHMQHVANLFSVSLSTTERVYETWSCAIGQFSFYQQPMPTGPQLAALTPARMSARLNLASNTGVLIGDCTETPIDDPGTTRHAPEHTCLWSDYKKKTTTKFLTICAGNSYLAYISGAMCGGITDNQAHKLTSVANLVPSPRIYDI
eukprot:Lithocolla_globosa_v1_NODE_2605_length_1937_cov_55.284803.p1 type:complete len:512 gc:universal NODE_2605_length_1937_cov_55.284803:175-1710(+)